MSSQGKTSTAASWLTTTDFVKLPEVIFIVAHRVVPKWAFVNIYSYYTTAVAGTVV